MEFNDYEWHDAVIKHIHIDRSDPGNNDTVRIDIVWPDGKTSVIEFYGVYRALFMLNFGIVADETILCASMDNSKENEELIHVYRSWSGYLDELVLCCYKIDLNSTAGLIQIIAKGFKIYPL